MNQRQEAVAEEEEEEEKKKKNIGKANKKFKKKRVTTINWLALLPSA